MTEVMDRDEVIPTVDVPEREIADLEITVNTEPEHTSDDSSSWADQTAQAEPTPSHSDENFRPSYPSHLRSEIMAFDRDLPGESLDELPTNDQQLWLNIVLHRPCSATFTLADNSVDSRYILRLFQWEFQKLGSPAFSGLARGEVNVTFAKAELRDLFFSKLSTTLQQRPTVPRQPGQPGIFVTVRDAPWELLDKLIQQRLEQFGVVHSIS